MKPVPHPLETTDLSYFQISSTANHQYKAAPRLLTSAQGIHYHDDDGHGMLDGTAGLWCINASHCRKKTVGAIMTQTATLDLAPTFQVGHPLAFRAAEEITETMLEGLNRILFASSGSEAANTVLKIAPAYRRARSEEQCTRLVGRERGYHGVGFGSILVGGISPNRKMFSTSLLSGVDRLPYTHASECNAFSKDRLVWGEHLADELERLVMLHGVSTIAAVIVEPLTDSIGVLVSPKGYLQCLRALCDKRDILLTFDEVIAGSGRLGAAAAVEFLGMTLDLLAMVKGINSAVVPMGAVAMHQSVYDTAVDAGTPDTIEPLHDYTYSAHPLAATAAVATPDLYRSKGLFERARSLSLAFETAAHSVKDTPYVRDIRNLGLVASIELESRPDAVGAHTYEVFLKCLEHDVLVHYTGDILASSPPFIIEEVQIARIFDTVHIVL